MCIRQSNRSTLYARKTKYKKVHLLYQSSVKSRKAENIKMIHIYIHSKTILFGKFTHNRWLFWTDICFPVCPDCIDMRQRPLELCNVAELHQAQPVLSLQSPPPDIWTQHEETLWSDAMRISPSLLGCSWTCPTIYILHNKLQVQAKTHG